MITLMVFAFINSYMRLGHVCRELGVISAPQNKQKTEH